MEVKNTAPRSFKISIFASTATALAASILYIIAYHFSYDKVVRHFDAASVLPYVFGILMAVSTAIFTVGSILLSKKYIISNSNVGSAETFGLWLCGLMFLVFGILSVDAGETQAASKIGAFCTSAMAPLSIFSLIPFALRTSRRLRNSTLHALSTFAPVLWGICILFKYYFDLKEMPINDPELTLTMVSISCAVIFFLCECRFALGIATPALAVFSASAVTFLTGAVSIARVVLWKTDGHMIPAPGETTLLLAVAVLGACRLWELSSTIVPVSVETAEETVEAEVNEETEETEETEELETSEPAPEAETIEVEE